MGEKGSIKNLYKDLLIRINYRKKNKKEKKANKNIKLKTSFKSKTKLSLLLFFNALFGIIKYLFTPSSMKHKQKKYIKEIVKDGMKLEQYVESISEKIKQTNNPKELIEYQSEMIYIENNIKNDGRSISKNIEFKVINIKRDINKKLEKADVTKDNTSVNETKLNISLKQNTIDTKEDLNNDLQILKEQIKKLNKKYDEIIENKEINTLKELIDLEKIIIELKRKIELENENYTLEDLKKIDDYLRIKNNEEILKLKEKVTNKIIALKNPIKEIEEYEVISKNQIIENKRENTKQNVNENKNNKEVLKNEQINNLKQEEEKLKRVKKEINNNLKRDIIMSSLIINQQLLSNEKIVREIRKSFNNRPSFFRRIKRMSFNTFRLCISTTPLFTFKNKTVGLFTSSILLNNSIRSLRKSISPQNNSIEYIRTNNLYKYIKEQNELIEKSNRILNDSLHQIQSFKHEFLNQYSSYINIAPDINEIIEQISEIESYITNKQLEYEKTNKKVKQYIYDQRV